MIPEKLIKEIIEQARCIIAEDGSPMEHGRACYLIRHIAGAFRDGELDEMLGVVGRLGHEDDNILKWLEQATIKSEILSGLEPILVAFCPTGMEKER